MNAVPACLHLASHHLSGCKAAKDSWGPSESSVIHFNLNSRPKTSYDRDSANTLSTATPHHQPSVAPRESCGPCWAWRDGGAPLNGSAPEGRSDSSASTRRIRSLTTSRARWSTTSISSMRSALRLASGSVRKATHPLRIHCARPW